MNLVMFFVPLAIGVVALGFAWMTWALLRTWFLLRDPASAFTPTISALPPVVLRFYRVALPCCIVLMAFGAVGNVVLALALLWSAVTG